MLHYKVLINSCSSWCRTFSNFSILQVLGCIRSELCLKRMARVSLLKSRYSHKIHSTAWYWCGIARWCYHNGFFNWLNWTEGYRCCRSVKSHLREHAKANSHGTVHRLNLYRCLNSGNKALRDHEEKPIYYVASWARRNKSYYLHPKSGWCLRNSSHVRHDMEKLWRI